MINRDLNELSTRGLNERIWNGVPRENLATRVANAIREQVQSGKLERGVQLRGEVEFARELGVSRQTLREATRLLTLEGLLTIRHGVGTFVAESQGYLSSPLDTMHSMSALIRENGNEARVDGLKIRQVAATAEVATALDVPESSPVAEIFRLRLAGATPLVVAYDYIALLDDAEWKLPLIKMFDGGSIYEFMATKLQRHLISSEATVTAVAASKKHAELLHVKPGFPLLLMREIQFEAQRRRGLYSVIYHNSSLVQFTLARPGTRS
ncbi:GntR family transcriptional regulator [Granulicella mallensis]|jgi:GntR family transcriptional regulator|uniref:GntR family transcriptional regulator n=1 Tax=Granulicella mallensis TaxID=940614 RepID=A0A7W7ZTD9_9BACT|nr:GntR family transcriptional regulator [Granulicella mallensis]MBB5065805.1 GntR family transcriptional regulator [Granulicella mallensis]